MSQLNIYTIFHLNIAFSSIEEDRWPEVIKTSYWPLLKLAEKFGSVGIEITGYTLEQVKRIDPSWVKKFRQLLEKGRCELLGSGYAQIIGPLVPSLVNLKNLEIGNQTYRTMLNCTPKIAYVNEQAYSPGLLENYLKAGYQAIFMEWNNPASSRPNWDKEYKYHPQLAVDSAGHQLPVLWNDSIAFQKFQRYTHSDIEIDEYLDYIDQQLGPNSRSFPLYGNDVEVFDFRPARFHTEAELAIKNEWQRIETLFDRLSKRKSFRLVLPGKVLADAKKTKVSLRELTLETADQPIPVKKQEKYNISRWGITGRDDLGINTACYRIYKHLESISEKTVVAGSVAHQDSLDQEWKELCYLWSSDFRTHITEKRFKKFKKRLEKKLANIKKPSNFLPVAGSVRGKGELKVSYRDRFIDISGKNIQLSLNTKKGLAIESLSFAKILSKPLIRTMEHGYYHDITLGADFYSGSTVIQTAAEPQVTDFGTARVTFPGAKQSQLGIKKIVGAITTSIGLITKTYTVFENEDRVDIEYELDLKNLPKASIRAGFLTFFPEAFDLESLYYATYNGGEVLEKHCLKDIREIKAQPVSFMVSSRYVLGNTKGILEIGDRHKRIIIQTDMSEVAALPKIHFQRTHDDQSYFFRVLYSLGEFDETNRNCQPRDFKQKLTLSLKAVALT